MTEINNYDEIEQINEQLEESINSNEKLEQTIEFINECHASIFDFSKDNTNKVVLKPKEKMIKKKYKLYQYNLIIENYAYIGKFATFSEKTKYLENFGIKINLKILLKNKLLKIELII